MATREQRYITTVVINNKDAEQKLEQLKAKIQSTREQMDKAYASGNKALGDALAKQVKATAREMKQFQLQTMDVSKILDRLSDASISQLQKTAKHLNAELRNIPRNTEEYKRLSEQLQRVNTELRNVRQESGSSESWGARLNATLSKWQTSVFATIGAVTGLSMTIRKATDDFAKMDEAMTDVRKYTGLSKEEVASLNEELKRMDTRTSREELNALAGDAGRLGKTSRDDILEFVDAADKIKVALGDDLGETAVRDIGKLSETFGVSDSMGLRAAMLSTASAVNELAQSSSASAGYIVDYTARFAGLGNQAEMTQAQIMGIAAVLDQNMQHAETSSTAVAQLMTQMFSEPAKFAKIAGLSVKEFSDTLKRDANEALLQFLEAMRSKGGFADLAPMFDDMGLSGTRCVGVLSTLATKLDDVRQQQKIAADAFSEGTSVINEFEVQNQSVQAQIDKQKNKFHELSVELGEKLMPVVRTSVSVTNLLVSGLIVVADVLVKSKTTIVAAALALAMWNAAAIKSLIVTKVTAAVNLLTKVFRTLNAVVKANPWTALATVVMTVGAAIYDYVTNIKSAVKATNDFNSAAERQRREQDAIAKSANGAKEKFMALREQWKSLSKQSEQIDWIKANKDAFAELGLKINNVNDANNVLIKNSAKVIDALVAVAEAAAMSDLYQGSLKKREEWLRQTNNRVKYRDAGTQHYNTISDDEKQALADSGIKRGLTTRLTVEEIKFLNAYRIEQARKTYAEKKKLYDDEVEYYRVKMVNAQKKVMTANKTLGGANVSTATPKTEKQRKEEERQRKKEEAASRKREAEIKRKERESIQQSKEIAKAEEAANKARYASGEISYREYLDNRYKIAEDELRRELALYKEGDDRYTSILAQIDQTQAERSKSGKKQSETDIIKESQEVERQLRASFYDITSDMYGNTAALDEALFQNEYQTLMKRRELYKDVPETYRQMTEELEVMDTEHQANRSALYDEMMQQYSKSYKTMSNDKKMKTELAIVEELYKKKLLKEEEYQKARRDIEKRYRNKSDSLLDTYGGDMDSLSSGVVNFGNALSDLQAKIKEGTADWKDYVAVACAGLSSVMSVMSSMSQYYTASCNLEVAQTEKKYESMIEAAGSNEKKKKKLEEQREAEVAKIKTKYNKKAMKIEVAQALASTAMAAINAYSSAAQVPFVGYILAPIAAAAAVAAGMLQVAAIRKQHEAQAAGYYKGGFTGGNDYTKQAGVVHQGEFVANHDTVNNPQIAPLLRIIDNAQRHNTSGSLKASELFGSSQMNVPIVAPVVNVTTDNTELQTSLEMIGATVRSLTAELQAGIYAYSVIDGPNGSYAQTRKYEKMLTRK